MTLYLPQRFNERTKKEIKKERHQKGQVGSVWGPWWWQAEMTEAVNAFQVHCSRGPLKPEYIGQITDGRH